MHHATPKYRAADYLDGGHQPISENFGTTGYVDDVLMGNWRKGSLPNLWDGHTAKRVIEDLKSRLG